MHALVQSRYTRHTLHNTPNIYTGRERNRKRERLTAKEARGTTMALGGSRGQRQWLDGSRGDVNGSPEEKKEKEKLVRLAGEEEEGAWFANGGGVWWLGMGGGMPG